MKRLSITVGLGFDTNGQLITPQSRMLALTNVRVYMARMFGGYTETQGYGGWINDAGELIEEESVTFTSVITDETTNENGVAKRAGMAAEYVRNAFNQTSVLLVKDEVGAFFIEKAIA